MRAQFRTRRPDWCRPLSFLSELYVGDGILFDIRGNVRQRGNAHVWESITLGLLGPQSLKLAHLEEAGKWGPTHTMLGFEIDSEPLRITPPVAKIAGARVLFDHL